MAYFLDVEIIKYPPIENSFSFMGALMWIIVLSVLFFFLVFMVTNIMRRLKAKKIKERANGPKLIISDRPLRRIKAKERERK